MFGAAFLALANLAAPLPAQWVPPTLVTVVALSAAAVVAMGPALHEIPIGLLLLAAPKLASDRARARQLHQAALEQESARRLVEERLRIAREVHDVVSHGLATIALRAGVADHVMDRDPREGQEALRAIRAISTESLSELGGLLDVLRAGAAEDRAPVPDLARLPSWPARLLGVDPSPARSG